MFSGLIHQVVCRRRLGTLFTRSLFGSDPDLAMVEFARRLMAGAPRQTTIDAPKAVLRFDFGDRLDQVTLPTLVLAGSKDRSVKPEHTQALADGIPQASLQRFYGPGTWWCWNAPTRSQGPSPSSRPVAPKGRRQ